ncbi:hypothetical protein AN221_15180, partial [Streptomyces nanshensis]
MTSDDTTAPGGTTAGPGDTTAAPGGPAAPGLIPAPRTLTRGAPGAEPFRLDAATVLDAAPGTEGVARDRK